MEREELLPFADLCDPHPLELVEFQRLLDHHYEECSSDQEKDVLQPLNAPISRPDQEDAQTSCKSEHGHEEQPPQTNDKTRRKLVGCAKKPKKERGPRYAITAQSDIEIIDDGYKWRKYGQKAVKNSPYPRSYYKCTDKHCGVKKHVERQANEPLYVVTTYEGTHNHAGPTPIQVIYRLPQAYDPFPLPFQMDLQLGSLISQTSYNYPMPQAGISDTTRNEGLLEDVISGELRMRSI